MKTVTFGNGGDYTAPSTAYTSVVWDDDILFLQVGVSSDSNWFNVSGQNGYSAIFQGNGDAISVNTGADSWFNCQNAHPSGDLIIEHCTIIVNGADTPIINNTRTGATASSYKHIIRYCDITLNTGGKLYTGGSNNLSKLWIYGNHIRPNRVSPGSVGIINLASTLYANTSIAIEDNFFDRSAAAASGYKVFRLSSNTSTNSINRNYVNGGFNSNSTLWDATTALASGATTDNYCSYVDTDLSVTHDEILFSTDNFLSIGTLDPLYGVPKSGSPVFDDATQLTNIPDNVIGLNGIPVNYRAAGPYTPPVQINPPTGLTASYTGTGVLIEWTDYSPVQVGYEKVNVFYETVSIESAFTTAKATVNGGVEEYTIPYAELTASPVWYVRLSHGA